MLGESHIQLKDTIKCELCLKKLKPSEICKKQDLVLCANCYGIIALDQIRKSINISKR